MSPIGLAMAPIILACSHGVFGADCDVDIKCWHFLKMPACRERFFGPIQTDAYREALRRGRNVPAKIIVEPPTLADFIFEVR